MRSDTAFPATASRSRVDPPDLTADELEAELTLAARRRTIFDDGRLRQLLAERDRRRRLLKRV